MSSTPRTADANRSESVGKIVVVSIFAVALAAALFAWWWRYTSQREIQQFWGKSAQQTISAAQRVEAFRLPSEDAATENVDESSSPDIAERVTAIPAGERVDLSSALGLVHAKHSLLDKASYQWGAQPGEEFHWEYGVRFSRWNDTVTVLFDFEWQAILRLEAAHTAKLIEKTSRDWKDYLDRRAFGRSPP